MTLITEERAPSAQEYCALRIKAGLSEKSLKAAEIGLHRGYLTSATLEGSYVSMVADKPSFYEKFGWKSVGPASEGMSKKFG
ncbi:hypothetical protein [Morganella morganii]|uniref:hypothetical protein n=1 Tax=Morganella morganii TaxID=582 RepID=UPI003315AEAE